MGGTRHSGVDWRCPSCGRFAQRLARNNPEHRRRYDAFLVYRRRNYDRVRAQAIEVLGGACKNFGIKDIRVLQINHKYGGGTRDFGHDPVRSYRDIVKDRRDRLEFGVRCANCNILFEYESKRRRVLPR